MSDDSATEEAATQAAAAQQALSTIRGQESAALGQLDGVIPDDALAQLTELSGLQAESLNALVGLMAAGNRPPNDAYERFLTPARRVLEIATTGDVAQLAGFDVPGWARGLVVQLGIYADHRQADGERAQADALRTEADGSRPASSGTRRRPSCCGTGRCSRPATDTSTRRW